MGILQSLRDGVVNSLIQDLSGILPRLATALLILFAGIMIARLVERGLRRLLVTLKIDKFAEGVNEVDMLYKNNVAILPSYIISRFVYLMMVLVVAVAATDLLGVSAITQMISDFIHYLPALFTGGLILVAGLFVADMVRKGAETTLRSMAIPSASIISNVIFYILFISIALSALAQAHISTGFLANNLTVILGAFALAFAVGYGLASRELLSNYMASIYNREKIRVGDNIIIDGKSGQVVMIDATSLILQTSDRAIIVPLSKLTSSTVEVIYPDPTDDKRIEGNS